MLPGTSILLYTDGLIERRDRSLDVGLERLRSTAEGALNGSPTNEAITELLEGMIEGPRPTDDVALLVLHRDSIAAIELEFAVEARPVAADDPPVRLTLARRSRGAGRPGEGDRDGRARGVWRTSSSTHTDLRGVPSRSRRRSRGIRSRC